MEADMATPKKAAREERVLKEYERLGKYRVRVLENARKPEAGPVLDIREYVAEEGFEGFTRKGIRLSDRAHLERLRALLGELLVEAPAPPLAG
jgi:hypothetical protein